MSELNLQHVAEQALDYARQQGMDQCEVSLHQGTGVAITARQQELETVEKHNDAQLVVSVFNNHQTGSASSADLSEQGLRNTVNAAISIARHTGADDCFGLADKALMATDLNDLGLYNVWEKTEDQLLEIALACENAALQSSDLIVNSEGASVNSYNGIQFYANSHGFANASRGSQHSISCSVIGEKGDSMQRDYWYDSNCNASKLESAEFIGQKAAERTVKRLGGRQIPTIQAPVLYEPGVAKSLIGHLIGGLKGGAIYKKASFLLDKVGESVLPEFVSISESPHEFGASSSAMHDNEGVATPQHRAIVDSGVIQSYILGSYTARKLGLQTTANSGGVRNLKVSNTGHSLQQMLSQMDTGFFVTELIGSGINMLTGDYSRGAAGFWVENGEIQFPVEEVTVAGNLSQMYKNIVAIGSDTDLRGNTECGSILIENMTIAGS
jgi:PmbA protein